MNGFVLQPVNLKLRLYSHLIEQNNFSFPFSKMKEEEIILDRIFLIHLEGINIDRILLCFYKILQEAVDLVRRPSAFDQKTSLLSLNL